MATLPPFYSARAVKPIVKQAPKKRQWRRVCVFVNLTNIVRMCCFTKARKEYIPSRAMVENTKRTTVYFNKIMYIYNEDQHCIFITKINIFRARKHENMNCIYYFYTTKESKRLAYNGCFINFKL